MSICYVILIFMVFQWPYKKEISGKCHQNCPEIVQNFFSCPENVWKMSGKMIVWNFSYPKNQTNSGHIPDMKKIWTKSGQINWTNSGHEKFYKFFPDILCT